MKNETAVVDQKYDEPNWMNIVFLSLVHLLGVCGVVYAIFHFSWPTIILAVIFFCLRALGITGYHRYYTHRAYKCSRVVQVFYLLFGAASFQNSVMRWASDHRNHHRFTDTDQDPYGINRGFWNSHIGWVLRVGHPIDFSNVRDLERDALVAFQHRWYVPIGLVVGVVLPVLLGFLWGDLVGAFLIVSALGLTLQYHATFSVNSFAHLIGTRPYLQNSSARNSWLVSVITFGEGGGHNRHHRYPGDYRTGIRWWSFDPPKWFVWNLSKIGLTWDLRVVS